jgi:hypothetical protein
MRALVYDIEILRAIPPRDGSRLDGIEYCEGFHDHANAGVAVMCCMEVGRPWEYRVFLGTAPVGDSWGEVWRAYPARVIRNLLGVSGAQAQDYMDQFDALVSFNGVGFDNQVLAYAGVNVPRAKCYDLLREVWRGMGLDPNVYHRDTHGGVGLGKMAEANLRGMTKTGNGAMAPVWWQRGEYVKVIEYCLMDCYLTARLMELVENGGLRLPCGQTTIWPRTLAEWRSA